MKTCELIFYKKNLGMVFHGVDETITIIGISNKMKKVSNSNNNSPIKNIEKQMIDKDESGDCFKVDNENYDKYSISTETSKLNIRLQETFDLLQENLSYVKFNPVDECKNRIWLVYEYLDDFLLGSTIISINDINVLGLDVYYQQKLLEQRKRPLKLVLGSPLMSSNTMIINEQSPNCKSPNKKTYNKISYQLFLTKYHSNCTSKLRSKVDSILKDYIECDWKKFKLTKGNTLPQATIVSIYKYIEIEMLKLELFNSKHKRGLFMPEELLESHWDDIYKHIETLVFSKVSTFTNTLWDIYKEDYIGINQMLSHSDEDFALEGNTTSDSFVSGM